MWQCVNYFGFAGSRGVEMLNVSEFEKLMDSVTEIAGYFPEGVAFIGGIAVYLHAINHEKTLGLAEFTHDADMYISLSDMADLRDIEEVTPNRRLSKHQMIKHGFEFDIYTERQSSLVVPYDEVIANAVTYDAVKVAGLEHLFVLKLEAFKDRFGSAKGEKDAKDLVRIVEVARLSKSGFDCSMVAPYLSKDDLDFLKRIEKGREFMSMAKGNAMKAKELRGHFAEFLSDLSIEVLKTDSLSARFGAVPASGARSGVIEAMSDTEVIQHVGREEYVVWPRSELSGMELEIGKMVHIDKQGKVHEDKEGGIDFDGR